jgi:predicted phosphodiesterase
MILFCGDPHGHFGHIIDAVQEHQPAAVILLGDLQAQRPLEVELASILDKTEVWFIHGNHDTDSEADHDNIFSSKLANRNLHGRVVEIAGQRIAGLGGVIFSVDYERLQKQRADILVTHEAPSSHPHGFAIDELASRMGVSKAIHGHHIAQLDYSAERTRLGFDAFGVGFRGIIDQDGLRRTEDVVWKSLFGKSPQYDHAE